MMFARNMHLSDRRIDELVEGRPLSVDETDHLAICGRCGEILTAEKSVERALRGSWSLAAVKVPATAAPPSRGRALGALALSGALVGAVIVAVVFASLRTQPPSVASAPSPSLRPTAAPPASAPAVSHTSAPTDVGPSPSQPELSISPASTSPPTTATGSPSPAYGRIDIPGVVGLGRWSPDGEHLVVDPAVGDPEIVDKAGEVQGTISANIGNIAWLDSATLAALVTEPGSTQGMVMLYDVRGSEVGHVDGLFDAMVASAGNRLIALSPVSAGAPSSSYEIWDDGTLSGARPGAPLAWSTDGAKLAVLVPGPREPVPPNQGSLVIVSRDGSPDIAAVGWQALANNEFAFSFDDRFLAGCASTDANAPQRTIVVDTSDGHVSGPVASQCAFHGLGWGPDATLYVSDGISRPMVWTPGAGLGSAGITGQVFVTPAANGSLAAWSDGSAGSSLRLTAGTRSAAYDLPNLSDVRWSPDGAYVAAASLTAVGQPQVSLIAAP